MRRRGLMAGAIAAGALMLGGCGPLSLQSRVNRAAEKIDGVDSSELRVGLGGTFEPQIGGEVYCAVGEEELETVFDEAWRAVVTLLHDKDDGIRQVAGVVAYGNDGSLLDSTVLLPDDDKQFTNIGSFYDRYGLE